LHPQVELATETYSASGVDYDVLDALKRAAGREAGTTSYLLAAREGSAREESRGESAFVFDLHGSTLALVQECLGTKSAIATRYEVATGELRYDAVAFDAVAAIANDLICVGALPLVINAYFATGAAGWYTQERVAALVRGWSEGCKAAGAVWGGGESPSLPGLVDPLEVELAGCGVGRVPDGAAPLLGEQLSAGDEIVLVESSGLHANGATLARRVAEQAEGGLRRALPSGTALGEALLVRSIVYVALVESLLEARQPLTYMAHLTGHGLRKLMRARREFTYRVSRLPPVPEVLEFLVSELKMSAGEAYGTFNMGCGFAVFVRPGGGDAVVAAAEARGVAALVAGVVEEGPRRVVLEPVDVAYDGRELSLR
jgi:phosphoribosylformylglycinamidine cyclo-ligase